VLKDILNFLPLSETLLSGGMPTLEQMADVANAGVQLVVNLAPYDAASDLQDEAALVESRGMEYLNIPVEWDSPRPQDLQAFMDAMDRNANKKILVHCRANYRATGFITLYRVLRLGWEPAEAFEDLRRIWRPEEYPVWEAFIKNMLAGEA
jgi:protein tyrosine phosphatase (PTP) superfamily phosphohydrolase (DUF442 family)